MFPTDDPTSTPEAPASGETVRHALPGEVPRMRADARRNRERIIEAARKVFAETGSVAQMDDVAAEAGVGVGTVYRHFPTKDELMGELLVEKFTRILGYLEEAKAAGGDPGEELLKSLLRSAEQMEADTSIQNIMSAPQGPGVWKAASEQMRQVNLRAGELIRAGKASGTLRHDMSVVDIRLIMGGVCSTMADPLLRPLWRRHMTLMIDSLRGPAAQAS